MINYFRNIIIWLYERYCVEHILEQQRLEFIQKYKLLDYTDEEIDDFARELHDEKYQEYYRAGLSDGLSAASEYYERQQL